MDNRWQRAFDRMTYGIYVLTVRHVDIINAMIASWVAQVSHSPPLVMAAVHPNRYSHDLIEQSNCFALHVAAHTRVDMIERMMRSDPAEKFRGLDWQPGKTGCPILSDCLAWFECEVVEQHRPGNHTMFIARVVNADTVTSGKPLCTNDCQGSYSGKE